ncbi:MAG TPA: hypothetical protein VFF27_00100 [Bacteroidia bacterium]|nr:hypothetical protein [Bacteroidia bacterium]
MSLEINSEEIRKPKLRGDIFKEHSDKLGLLWTNDQWQTAINSMEEYANLRVKEALEEVSNEIWKLGIGKDEDKVLEILKGKM